MENIETLDDACDSFVNDKISFEELKQYLFTNDFDTSDIDINKLFMIRAINRAKRKEVNDV